jgi:hypothetical protein
MLRSWKSRVGVLAIAAMMLVGVPLMGAASAAAAANDANAKLCQKNGWQSWVRADQTPFLNPGDCVSYGAHGGTLTAPESAAQILCESYGGTYGNSNLTFGSFPTILWTCNGWHFVSDDDLQAKYVALGNACLAGGGDGYALRGVDATMTAYFTCGHS